MKDQIREYAKALLNEGKVAGFLALREENGNIRPYFFTDPDELDHLAVGDTEIAGAARYPLVKILMRMHRAHPHQTFGIMVRGCEERAIRKLLRASQLSAKRVVLAGFSCSDSLAARCGCLKPYPDELVAGSKPKQPSSNKVVEATGRNFIRDLQFMKEQFERCVKCYGCRNVCPVCFCKECTLEEQTFVPQSRLLPPANPDFLLTRAVHMVDYCVYCGLCEEACPADIPLKTVYKMVANIMNEQHGYAIQGVPGRGDDRLGEEPEKEAVA